jgi:cobalt-zinc-cadmium resistance protein CzcA
MQELIDLALKNNPATQASTLEIERQTKLKRTSTEIPKTDVSFMYGQYNSVYDQDNNLTISQSIPFPTVFTSQSRLAKEKILSATLQDKIARNELALQVKYLVNRALYLKALQKTWMKYDSLYTDLTRVAEIQYKTGEGTLLSKTSAETLWREMQDKKYRNEVNIQVALQHLQLLCKSADSIEVDGNLENLVDGVTVDAIALQTNPTLALAQQEVIVSTWQRKATAAQVLPDLRVGYFNQTLVGTQNVNGQDQYFGPSQRFQGFQLGLAIPLWIVPSLAKVKAARIEESISAKRSESIQLGLTQEYAKALQDYNKNSKSLAYYKDFALKTTDLLIHQSKLAYKNGEVDYNTLLLNYRQALGIQENYWNAWQEYNQSIFNLQYLNGTY